MEYKIFGPFQHAPEDFKADLEAFFRLDQTQRDAIEVWLLSTGSYDLYPPELPLIIVASTLLPEQFRQAAGVIIQLIRDWQYYGLEIQDIERDLLLLGFGLEHLEVLSGLMARLSSIKERIWLDGVKVFQRSAGLPTIDDVNILWNARPLFGSEPYGPFVVEGDVRYRRFFGLTYLATVEIITSDSYERKQRTAIQIDEEGFERLLRGMKRASEQLNILKERTKTVVPDSEGPNGAID